MQKNCIVILKNALNLVDVMALLSPMRMPEQFASAFRPFWELEILSCLPNCSCINESWILIFASYLASLFHSVDSYIIYLFFCFSRRSRFSTHSSKFCTQMYHRIDGKVTVSFSLHSFFRLGPVAGRDYGKHIFSEILSHPFIMAVWIV